MGITEDTTNDAIDSMTKTYPDTTEGVLAMLDANFEGDFTDCEFMRDPYVEGVWMLTNSHGGQCLAYLAGYVGGGGGVRMYNDAEFTDEGWQH